MKVNLLATVAAIVLGFAIPVHAQETVAVVETVSAPPEIVASDALIAQFTTICESDAILSDKAKLACINDVLPKPAKSGDIFRNVGIGAEFNTLIRNAMAFSPAE